MHRKLTALVAVVVASLVLSGSALAFDCIRVSSSLQGLQASAGSGKWLPLDFSTPDATQQTVADVFEADITDAQAQCFTTAYAASGQPQFFAIGIGVAGPNGVLAWMNKNAEVLGDGKGIDQLETSGIFPAVIGAAIACGIPVD
jgi:hypothetical protein